MSWEDVLRARVRPPVADGTTITDDGTTITITTVALCPPTCTCSGTHPVICADTVPTSLRDTR